jgi:hypothetical protein
MAIQYLTRSDAEHQELLRGLLTERGLERYGLFAVTGEGTITPDGYEEASGYVLTQAGQAIFFWTGWDESAHRTAFSMWQPTEPQAEWQEDEEYLVARKAAGLV